MLKNYKDVVFQRFPKIKKPEFELRLKKAWWL